MVNILAMTKFCEDVNVLRLMLIIKELILVAKIAVPLILIIMASIDIYKGYVIEAGKDSAKINQIVLKRLVAALLVFFVPTIVNLVIDSISNVSSEISPCINITREKLDAMNSKSEETCEEKEGTWSEEEGKCYYKGK